MVTHLDLSLKEFPIKFAKHIQKPSPVSHTPSLFLASQHPGERQDLGVFSLCCTSTELSHRV